MKNTGRIERQLLPQARRLLFEPSWSEETESELFFISEVDRAHLLMLAECRIVSPEPVRQLLAAIQDLRAQRFAPLQNGTPIRGLFLLYEDFLIAQYGSATGGILQTARSRNDLNATILRLRLRSSAAGLLRLGLRLQAVLIRRAHRFSDLTMPAYTHGQAALPTTLGHYLAGVAQALFRDLQGFVQACDALDRCPLGAGAVGGSTLPIDTERTARLLGFKGPEIHSVDAVASRDIILRMLSAAAIFGITLSRLATDLMQWCTAEFGFLSLPDEVIGSSSAMPQKRNPFLLEHVQGKAGAALGAFVASATAMHSAPFTNSIAVGTEAVKHVEEALDEVGQAALLLRLVVGRIQPHPCVMLQRAERSHTTTTALANHLATAGDLDFRTAHRKVGELVNASLKAPHLHAEYVRELCESQHAAFDPELLDPASVARQAEWGGGPGPQSQRNLLDHLRSEWTALGTCCRLTQQGWRDAEAALERAVADFMHRREA